jgi:hypothetical protein
MTTNHVQEIVRKRLGPPPARPTKAELEQGACLECWMEAYDDHVMLEMLQSHVEKRTRRHAAAALRARRSGHGGPRLHLAGGQRTGRVGADRFKGRYVPHLIWGRDNTE